MVRESKKKKIKYISKYIKPELCGVAVRLSYIQDAWCIEVNRLRLYVDTVTLFAVQILGMYVITVVVTSFVTGVY